MSISADFGAWVDEASAVRVGDVIARRGVTLGGRGPERVGPCPVCGGDNRFSINTNKNVFHCRQAGRGGDAIALVEYMGRGRFSGCVRDADRACPAARGGRARQSAGAGGA